MVDGLAVQPLRTARDTLELQTESLGDRPAPLVVDRHVNLNPVKTKIEEVIDDRGSRSGDEPKAFVVPGDPVADRGSVVRSLKAVKPATVSDRVK